MKPGTACILLSNFEDAPHLGIIVKVNEAEPYQDVGNNGYKIKN